MVFDLISEFQKGFGGTHFCHFRAFIIGTVF